MSNNEVKSKRVRQEKRAMRVRRRLKADTVKPRLCVVKSNKHIQAQIIDDENGVTLAGVATYGKEFRNTEFNKKSKKAAAKLGEKIAALAKEKNIKEAVFDRGPFKYHGILHELAEAARAGGLKL